MKGRKLSEEHKKNVSLANKGKKRSREVKDNLSKLRFRHGITVDGYKRIKEHNYNYLTENKYGHFFIPKGWCVHHINGNKLDNRIENLIMLSNTSHRRLHALEQGLGKHKNRVVWNKGLTKEMDDRIKGGRPKCLQ